MNCVYNIEIKQLVPKNCSEKFALTLAAIIHLSDPGKKCQTKQAVAFRNIRHNLAFREQRLILKVKLNTEIFKRCNKHFQ